MVGLLEFVARVQKDSDSPKSVVPMVCYGSSCPRVLDKVGLVEVDGCVDSSVDSDSIAL